LLIILVPTVWRKTFRGELNKLAYEQNIVDKSGEIYRFHAHAFRHTVLMAIHLFLERGIHYLEIPLKLYLPEL
jgi:integrase